MTGVTREEARHVVADLRAAKAQIAEPEKWGKGSLVRLADGKATDDWGFLRNHIRMEQIACLCAEGAVCLTTPPGNREHLALHFLRRAAGVRRLYDWNDDPDRTHDEVMAAFDKAIALAEAAA